MCFSRGRHKGHRVEAVEDISVHISNEMEPLIADLETSLSSSYTAIQQMRDELDTLSDSFKEAQNSIQSFTETIEEAIANSETSFILRSGGHVENNDRELDNRIEAVYDITNSAYTLMETIDSCDNTSSPRTMEQLLWAQSKGAELIERSKEIFSKSPLKCADFVPHRTPNYNLLELHKEEYLGGGFCCPTGLRVIRVTDFSVVLEWNPVIFKPPEPFSNVGIVYCIEQRAHGEPNYTVGSKTENTSATISNLKSNTLYEFRIHDMFQKAKSAYSPALLVKTLNISSPPMHSIILRGIDPQITHSLYGWCESSTFRLLYRGSRDGFTSVAFHSKCDFTKYPTLTVIANFSGSVFGGFATAPWGSSSGPICAPGSFLFSLKSVYETEPAMFPVIEKECAIQGKSEYGPVFGRGPDLCVIPPFNTHFFSYSGLESSRHSYKDTLGLGPVVFADAGRESSFKVKEIEVFEVIK